MQNSECGIQRKGREDFPPLMLYGYAGVLLCACLGPVGKFSEIIPEETACHQRCRVFRHIIPALSIPMLLLHRAVASPARHQRAQKKSPGRFFEFCIQNFALITAPSRMTGTVA
jgi:hypothetical protein